MDAIGDFLDAITGAGLPAPASVVADGQLHRFATNGKAGDDSGWYVLHADGPVPFGAFGCWRLGLTQKWRANIGRKLTDEERREYRAHYRAMQRARLKEIEARRAEAAQEATAIWEAATPAAAHPYLTKKGVRSYGLRVDADGALLVPMRDSRGVLVSLQAIDANGEKLFLPGGRKKACYHSIGALGDVLYIAEGYATAASVHEATGAATVVAFDAGNLLPVAVALREKYPAIEIVIAADNDAREDGSENTGVAKAQAAAEAVNGRVIVPDLGGERCDFNDLHQKAGLDECRRQLSISLPETRATAQPVQIEPPKLAYEKDILAAFRGAVIGCGLVGEIATAQLLYLAVTSRLLDKPVSVGVKGHSSSGKSYTVGRVLDFFPPEAVVTFTGMSERALIYREDDYRHRTLVIYEVTGLREGNEDDLTSYFIRSLLSEGRIEYDVTVRGEDGAYATQRIVKEGPTNLVFTTTKTRIHAENETRILSLNTDDSTEQTKSVLAALAKESERRSDLGHWRQFQSWLQTAEHRVTIPFGPALAAAVPPLAVRLRRDFAAVLSLIRAHAILHQQTRERDEAGRIVAVLDDYAAVRNLVAPVISEGIGATVPDVVRDTVYAVEKLSAGTMGVTNDAIAKYLKIDKSNALRRARRAADGGYIRNMQTKRGQPAQWVIGEPLPETVQVLPDPTILAAQPATAVAPETRANPSGCAVAQISEGDIPAKPARRRVVI